MSVLTDTLETFRQTAHTEREKGIYFENLAKLYFQNEPRYKDLYSDVWLWERVQLVGSKLTKRITPSAFIEREERKTKATKAIAKCDTANKKLKAIIDNPAKQAQYVEYNANPDYRNIIEAANAESPDARRKPSQDAPKPSEAYKPSSIELETALAPP